MSVKTPHITNNPYPRRLRKNFPILNEIKVAENQGFRFL